MGVGPSLPAAPWARYKPTVLRARRIVSIDSGDLKFSNCGGPNIVAEILGTLRTIDSVLFYATASYHG
jgi:hypothetical protein